MDTSPLKPPRLFLRFFRWFCHPELEKYIEGDLMELYEYRLSKFSKGKADRLFIKDVVLLLRPSIIRPTEGFERLNNYGMFKNYLKVAFRNLSKNRSYVLINTLGMGIALACCITAYLLVAYNIEFDDYFGDSDLTHTVKVMNHLEWKNGDPYKNMVAPIVMAPRAVEEIAGIEKYTRYVSTQGYVSYSERAFRERISFADEDFFEIFNFNLKDGSIENFRHKKSVFLSQRLADKYFLDEDAVGKLLVVEARGKEYEVIVGGVFDKVPLNSTFNIEALMRMENYLDLFNISENDWDDRHDASTVFQLKDIKQLESVNAQFDQYVTLRNKAKTDTKTTRFELLPFSEKVDAVNIEWTYFNLGIPFADLLIFIILAAIILLVACFNLTNTTIAMTAKRLKEIGLRKVVGASQQQIANQFLLEIIITIALSILVGLLIAQIIVPEFAAMWGLHYGFADLDRINLIFTLVMLLFLSAVLAGAYPALIKSKLKPVSLLKGSLVVKGTTPMTRLLLVTQFSLSIIVLVAGLFFSKNTTYQQKISFGYDKDQVLTISIEGQKEYELFKAAIASNPKIEAVSVTDHHFGYGSYTNPFKIDTAEFTSHVYEVGANYFEVMGLPLVEGRNFREGSQVDYETAAIVNEGFVIQHGLKDPLNTQIVFQEVTYNIVGVVKNHLAQLDEYRGKDKDHFYRMARPAQYRIMALRTNQSKMSEVMDFAESEWKKLFPNKPFESQTQNDVLHAVAIRMDRNLKKIFLFLTVMGCILSVSGIYSLASLNIEKRTKEIGVRKVLGATIRHILGLINREFVIILSIAMILGSVGGTFLTNALMDKIYSQHIPITLVPVVLCGLFIFFVGVATTSTTIFRAARSNPAETLKDE